MMLKRSRGMIFKQCVGVGGAVLVTFALLLGVLYGLLWHVMFHDAQMLITARTEATAARLDETFSGVSGLVDELALTVEEERFDYDELRELLLRSLKRGHGAHSQLYALAISLAPEYRLHGAVGRMLYASLPENGGAPRFETIVDPEMYIHQSGFAEPRRLGKALWTEPYFDSIGKIMMTTYTVPLYRKDGTGKRTFIGIVSADLSLKWLSETLCALPRHYGVGAYGLISARGEFLVRPQEGVVDGEPPEELRKRIFARVQGSDDKPVLITDQDWPLLPDAWYLFDTKLETTGYHVIMVLPEKVFFARIFEIEAWLLGIGAVGLAATLLAVFLITRRGLRPLHMLAAAARRIGGGDFSCSTSPAVVGNDEIGELAASFCTMRGELNNYIGELTRATREREKNASELQVAGEIQQWILPALNPPFPGNADFRLAARIVSAKAVGGDLYDFFMLDEHRMVIAVGDVSGKGVPAAMFMAVDQTLHRGLAVGAKSTREILCEVNRRLCQNNDMMMFITEFLAVYDTRTGVLEFTNAGHNPPFLLRRTASGVEKITTLHGAPLAIMPQKFGDAKLEMAPGDTLFLYTDGVTEAADGDEEFFGEARLVALLEAHRGDPPDRLIAAVLSAVREFAGTAEQSDDITLLALQRLQ